MSSKNKSHKKTGPASHTVTRKQRRLEEQIRFQARRARQRGDLEASKALLASLVVAPVSSDPDRALWQEAATAQADALCALEDFASALQALPADDVPEGLLEALDNLWGALTDHPRIEGIPIPLAAARDAAINTLGVFAKRLEVLKDLDDACNTAWESVVEFQDVLITDRENVERKTPRVRVTLEELKHAS